MLANIYSDASSEGQPHCAGEALDDQAMCTAKVGCSTEASDGQGAVSNKLMGGANATRTGMLRKVTTCRVKLKRPLCSWVQEEDDAQVHQPKRAQAIAKDPAKHKWSMTAASAKEVQKMGTVMKHGGGPSTSQAAAIQTEEVPMEDLKKKLARGMNTAGKKEHISALQAQVERHDERIQMLQNLLKMEEKERKHKLEQMKCVKSSIRYPR